jgi:phenylpropionate dioxygenase-like ring-hydroxylating dioxygenase large terminal subunit
MNAQTIDIETPAKTAADWSPGAFTLRDAWFPVAHAPDAGTTPILRMVHSVPYHIWSDGGWRAANRHPADGRSGAGERIEHPIIERYGHLWVWFGDRGNADPGLIPDVPFLPRDRPQPAFARGVNFFHCTYELVLENILDLTHIDFVHGSMTGAAEHAEEDSIRFESTSETVTMIRTVKKRLTSRYQREVLGVTEPHQDQTVFTHVFVRSGVCFLHSHYSTAPSIPLMQSNTPESHTLTRANFAFGIQQTGHLKFRRAWPATAPIIAGQDESVLKPQNPRYYGRPAQRDCSTRFDAAGLQYRHVHAALVERQRRGDFDYKRDYHDGTDIAQLLRLKRMS